MTHSTSFFSNIVPTACAKWTVILSATVMMFLPSSVVALPSDAKQPIRLLADKATYKGSTGETTYSGNVTITQGSLKIKADKLSLKLSKSRSINKVIATGRPASMEQTISKKKGKAQGQANNIDYNNINGILTLTGNATLKQNGASFSGNKIRYSLSAGDVEATGKGKKRVELIFPPNELRNSTSIK